MSSTQCSKTGVLEALQMEKFQKIVDCADWDMREMTRKGGHVHQGGIENRDQRSIRRSPTQRRQQQQQQPARIF